MASPPQGPALLRRHRTVAIGFVAQVMQYGAALLLLPLVVTRLPEAEIGIWYLFATFQGLAALADFGFQPTFARAFSAAFAGAPALRADGLAPAMGDHPNLALAHGVLRVARRLYLYLACGVLLLLATGGLAYIAWVSAGQVNPLTVHVAWLVFVAGTALNLYFLWISPLLMGSGRVTQNYLFVIVTRGGFALLGAGTLLAGGGLLGLSMANLVAVLVARLVAQPMLAPVLTPMQETAAIGQAEILAALKPNAVRTGISALGAFLIVRFNVLALSAFAGLAVQASYSVTLQLLTALAAMAQVPTQIALPQLVAMRVRGDLAGLRRMVMQRQAFLLALMIIGSLCIALIGEPLLALIGSRVTLLPLPLLLALALVIVLEANHANCAFVITTGNRVPYVKPSILSGIAIAILATAAGWAGWGVAGVIAAQGLVQATYNNWKWPLEVWKELYAPTPFAEQAASCEGGLDAR